jgi:UPF0755 protein
MIWLLSACFVLDEAVDTPLDASDTTTQVFEVPAGSNARALGSKLSEAGLIDDENAWRYYLKSREAGGCLKAGRFELSRSMDMPTLMETMCGAPMADEEPFTIVEGWRIRDIDQALAEAGHIEAGAYLAAVSRPGDFELDLPLPGLTTLEGFLMPETYMVPSEDFDTERFVQRQLDTFAERFAAIDGADKLGERTLYEVVIVASMLEREEPRPSNRPIVAGIIWKRLDNGWQLGIDATSRYTLENWNDRKAFLKQLRDPDDPYNTRERKGLPPTPIGNPSLPSLEAALAPQASENWYYLHDGEGNLHPSRNAAEHEAKRAKYGVY